MAAALVHQQNAAEAFGKYLVVPDDPFAKLMYYLKSVKSCIPEFDLPAKLIDCRQYKSLSEDDKLALLVLAYIVSPDILHNKVFIVAEPGSSVLDGGDNNFYKITQATRVIAADLDQQVVIDGQSIRVNQVMVCVPNWVIENWLNPLKKAAQIIDSKYGSNARLQNARQRHEAAQRANREAPSILSALNNPSNPPARAPNNRPALPAPNPSPSRPSTAATPSSGNDDKKKCLIM